MRLQFLVAGAALAFGTLATAQQTNTIYASLWVNAAASNPNGPFTYNLQPPQTITLLVAGTPGQRFSIFNANPGLGGSIVTPGVPTIYGIADIGPLAFPPLEIPLDGIGNPGTFIGNLCTVGLGGTTSLSFTFAGLVNCGTYFNLQSVVITPAVLTGAYLSAATRLVRPNTPPAATPLTLASGDEVATYVAFSSCRTFSFYGTTHNSLYVCSNGFVTFGAPSTWLTQPLSFSPPAIAPLWADLNVAAPATLTRQDVGNQTILQWNGVPVYPNVGTNTFSMAIDHVTNAIVFNYPATTLSDCRTGISPGNMLATNFSSFGPTSVIGRIRDHLAVGTLGPYLGAPLEFLFEGFLASGSTAAAAFNLQGLTVTFTPSNAAGTAYTLN